MNWGKWIIVSFIIFAAFIGTLVAVCFREDISLVSKDYYKEELAYQDQIARIENASKLSQKPVIKIIDDHSLQIEFNQFNEVEKGELKLFRPSNPDLDEKFQFSRSEESSQTFAVENLVKGMYRARMQWTMNGKEFYVEQVIEI